MRSLLNAIVIFVSLSSCQKLVKYNANEVRLEEKDRNQNIKNIQRIRSATPKDSFSFVVISDSQRSYDELDDFVKRVNNYPDISFAILNGDITDFGLQSEYLWISQRMQKLSFPYIAVIGNHDMLGNGREIYKQMYGPENFSFSYSGSRFIVLNSNSTEQKPGESLPDNSWLQKELSSAPAEEKIFVISHIAPFSLSFDPSLEHEFADMLATNGRVALSIHGHEGKYYEWMRYGPPVMYIIVNSLRSRNYELINVTRDKIEYREMGF